MRAHYQKFLPGICHHRANAEFGFQASRPDNSHHRETVGNLRDRFHREPGLYVVDAAMATTLL